MIFTTNENEFYSRESAVFLEKDNWNDYSYRTTFNVTARVGGESVELGPVKIMSTDLDDGSDLKNKKEKTSTEVPEIFEELSGDYFSLGQGLEYYRTLSKLGRDIGDLILQGLRDSATFCEPDETVKVHKAFWDSLTRGSEAKKCFEEGSLYYFGERKNSKIEFEYISEVFEESESRLHFVFDVQSILPSTTNVLIGKNGSGKTRLLSKLAEDIVVRNDDNVFFPKRPLISRVVAISYSAFDNFDIPSDSGKTKDNDYRYIGIRKKINESDEYKIKTGEDHWVDVRSAISDIQGTSFVDEVKYFVNNYLYENIDDVTDFERLKVVFERMSSGQKISLSIICQLSAFLEDDSLVLFDEPENHLHPGLLWSMMVSVDRVLKLKKSFSIIATHSPVILQQVPSDYINVVYRHGSLISAEKVKEETFGENLQAIMEKSFGFVEPEHDYRSILRKLIKEDGYSKEGIEALFSQTLSLQARAFLSTVLKNEKDD